MRVLLISVDRMRPDALAAVPQTQEILKRAAFAPEGTTVDPSVTLPCHVSVFRSVDPARHGTTTNVYAPQMRPITGLFEVNTGAMAKGTRNLPYPALPLMREFRELGFGAVIASDCHDGRKLDCGFETARELLEACGFRERYILTDHGFEAVAL